MLNTSKRSRAVLLGFVVLGAALAACGPEEPGRSAAQQPQDDGEALFRGLVFMTGPAGEAVPEIRDRLSTRLFVSNETARARIVQVHDRLVDVIRRQDPSYFATFAAQIRTGDPLIIDAALRQGTARSLRAALALDEDNFLKGLANDPAALRKAAAGTPYATLGEREMSRAAAALRQAFADVEAGGDLPPDSGTCVVFVLGAFVYVAAAVDVAVAVNLGLAMNVALAINIEYAINVDQTVNTYREPEPVVLPAAAGALPRERLVASIADTFGRSQ